jgi:hypothetical protein
VTPERISSSLRACPAGHRRSSRSSSIPRPPTGGSSVVPLELDE